jgi:hypothetical protein
MESVIPILIRAWNIAKHTPVRHTVNQIDGVVLLED